MKTQAAKRVLPGFGLSLGYTLLYLSLLVLIPLAMLFFKTGEMGWDHFVKAVSAPRAVASYKLSIGASLIAATINVIFGVLVAWVLARYTFPGRALMDAIVDLPFALPTSVGGIALTTLYAPNGWIGQYLEKFNGLSEHLTWLPLGLGAYFKEWGFKGAYSPLGIIIALIFIGLPFVVRTVQPVLQELDAEIEEAAATLGAGRLAIFRRVLMPHLLPAILTGFTLAFARALGEYGSVVFISGNMPMKTEITPLLIITKLEQYDYSGATGIAVMMLLGSFSLLLLINGLQWWSARRYGAV